MFEIIGTARVTVGGGTVREDTLYLKYRCDPNCRNVELLDVRDINGRDAWCDLENDADVRRAEAACVEDSCLRVD